MPFNNIMTSELVSFRVPTDIYSEAVIDLFYSESFQGLSKSASGSSSLAQCYLAFYERWQERISDMH